MIKPLLLKKPGSSVGFLYTRDKGAGGMTLAGMHILALNAVTGQNNPLILQVSSGEKESLSCGELPRPIEVGASCFNHHCFVNDIRLKSLTRCPQA